MFTWTPSGLMAMKLVNNVRTRLKVEGNGGVAHVCSLEVMVKVFEDESEMTGGIEVD
jgi:hypothetical protein